MRILEYYGRFQAARGGWGRLPAWARAILLLLALPGVLLVLLSLLALGVSIVALSLLTVPAYRLLSAVTGGGARARRNPVEPDVERRPEFVDPVAVERPPDPPAEETDVVSGRPRRQIDVRIVED